MTGAPLLTRIRTTPWLAGLLSRFDFEPNRAADGPVEPVHLASARGRATQPARRHADGADPAYLPVDEEGDPYEPMVR